MNGSLKNRGKEGPFLSSLSFFLSLFHPYSFPEMVPSSGRITSSTDAQTSPENETGRQPAPAPPPGSTRFLLLRRRRVRRGGPRPAQATAGGGGAAPGSSHRLPAPLHPCQSALCPHPAGSPCSATTFLLAIRVSLVGNLAAWFSFSSLEVTHFHYPP